MELIRYLVQKIFEHKMFTVIPYIFLNGYIYIYPNDLSIHTFNIFSVKVYKYILFFCINNLQLNMKWMTLKIVEFLS